VAPTDLWLALGSGFLGGFGHCVGMCGPIAAAVSMGAAPGRSARAVSSVHLLYNLGRVTTYTCIGMTMGFVGSFVDVAGRIAGLQNAAAVIAGLLMILLGLGAAGAATGTRRLEARAVGKLFGAVRRLLEGGTGGRVYPLGLLLGFLPCGLSLSAFMGAAATGSPVRGLLFALLFALGTVPAMMLAGGVTAWLGATARGVLYRAGGILVAGLGLLFLLRGFGLHVAL